jgi:hypothetical protein
MLLAPVLVALQLVAAADQVPTLVADQAVTLVANRVSTRATHQVPAGAANQVPTLDVGPGCRAAVDVSGISAPEQSCLNDEQAARNDLAKEWAQFPAGDKTLCLDQTKDYNPSYVELQTCLELLRDARIPYPSQKPSPSVSTTGQP